MDKPDEGADMAAALSPLKPQKRKYQQRLTAARDCRGLGLFCGGGGGVVPGRPQVPELQLQTGKEPRAQVEESLDWPIH